MRPLLVTLLGLAVALPAHAGPAPKASPALGDNSIAVLDTFPVDDAVKDVEAALVTNALRGAVKKAVGSKLQVMSSETMQMMLPPEVQKCTATMCVAQITKLVQAKFGVGSEITRVGPLLALKVEVYSVSGEFLGGSQPRAKDLDGLLNAIDKDAPDMFAQALKLKARASDAPRETVELRGTIRVTANVTEADVSIDGVPQAQHVGPRQPASFDVRPGTHQVKVSKPGYFEDLRTVEITPGEDEEVAARLEPETAPSAAGITGGVSTMIAVTTEPRGALLKVDGKPIGRSPGNFAVTPGNHELTAELDLYLPVRQSIRLASGEIKSLKFEMKEASGRLEVTSNPMGALVYLDDRQLGAAEPTLVVGRLAPATYKLRLTLADHHDQFLDVTIRIGETTTVKAPEMRPSVGDVRVESTPAGARVELDGVERGVTPVSLRRLRGGPHELRLTLDDHDALRTTLTVLEGKSQTLPFALDAAFTRLEVRSSPSGAEVSIDGQARGRTPLAVDRLPEGEHVVRVTGNTVSHKVWEQKVVAVRKKPVSLDAKLTPILGRVVVLTEPPGARVTMDDVEVGISPAVLPSVLAGPHSFAVTMPGHRPARATQDVKGEKENLVQFSLRELLPAEKAAERMRDWEASTQSGRTVAWGVTATAAGLAVAAGVMGLVSRSTAGTRDAAYLQYRVSSEAATESWQYYVALNEAVGRQRVTALGLAGGAVAAAIGAGIAWARVPARPDFDVDERGARLSLRGDF